MHTNQLMKRENKHVTARTVPLPLAELFGVTDATCFPLVMPNRIVSSSS